MGTRGTWAVLAATVVLLNFSTTARAVTGGQVDTFEDGTIMGWSGAAPANISTGGPSGANDNYLKLTSTNNLAAFNLNQWSGNYASAGITDVALDLLNPNEDPVQMRLVLIGANGTRWTSITPADVPGDNTWRRYVLSLRQADLVNVQDTGDTWAASMANAQRLLIRHDTGPGAGGTHFIGTLGMDNITAVVPEPASTALLLASAALVVHARRPRRRS